MGGVEHGPDLISTLPTWVQVAANLGIFVVAVVAAAFGFWRKVLSASTAAESLFAEGGRFHSTADDVRVIAEAVERMAAALEALLNLLQHRERQEDIDREVERRLSALRDKDNHA